MQEVKKSMLECLMAALQSGQGLISSLNEIATSGAVDSLPMHYTKSARTGWLHEKFYISFYIYRRKRNICFSILSFVWLRRAAVAKVEQWLEELHNRRRLLEVTWQRRKLNLEKYRTLSILKYDLELLETLLNERYELLSRNRHEFGNSAAEAEQLLERHLKLIPEATVILFFFSYIRFRVGYVIQQSTVFAIRGERGLFVVVIVRLIVKHNFYNWPLNCCIFTSSTHTHTHTHVTARRTKTRERMVWRAKSEVKLFILG